MKLKRSGRWMILPFTAFGCVSRSSVAADAPATPNLAATTSTQNSQIPERNSPFIAKTKHPLGFRLPNPNLSNRIRRLIRSLKTVSHLFVYQIEDNEDEDNEMEIGYPTDVKHLTHIGWDGSTTISNAAKGWENLTPKEIASFPSISLKQFEAAMAKQAAATATQKHV